MYIHTAIYIYIYATPELLRFQNSGFWPDLGSNQAEVRINVQKEFLVQHLDSHLHVREVHLFSTAIEHRSGTRSMLWQLHRACNSSVM